jgi:uncharacterized small protein (DUF1192 family)
MAEKSEKSNGAAASEEPEVTPIGPGAAQEDETLHTEGEEESRARSDEDEGDERVGRDEDDEGGEDTDGRREKRRRERKWKRNQEKNNRVELRFLRQRNEELERRQSAIDARFDQVEVGQVDTRVGMIDDQIAEAERLHAEAITKQNGAAATEALQIRDQLRDQKAQLVGVRNQKIHQSRNRQQQNPAMDPAIAQNARNWVEDNDDWFDPQLRDEDSRIARAIEDVLFSEGRLDARTPEYWEEYNRRLAKRGVGPFAKKGRDRDRDDEDEEESEEREEKPPQERRRPKGPRITTGGRERPLKKGEVYISADRRAAMEEAGVWDKPDLRQKYLRQYARYDAEHRGDRNRR